MTTVKDTPHQINRIKLIPRATVYIVAEEFLHGRWLAFTSVQIIHLPVTTKNLIE